MKNSFKMMSYDNFVLIDVKCYGYVFLDFFYNLLF